MLIHILSDIHAEFGAWEVPPVARDVAVLAGDVHLGRNALPILRRTCETSPVVNILGNHEYYNHEFDAVLQFWQACKEPNLHFLENRAVVIGGVRFVGATLWTDMHHGDEGAVEEALLTMSDYSVIRRGDVPLHPADTMACFAQSLAFLQRELASPFSGPTVVVTHHLPSYQSVAPQFAGDPANPSFASDLEDLIHAFHPALWIHGAHARQLRLPHVIHGINSTGLENSTRRCVPL